MGLTTTCLEKPYPMHWIHKEMRKSAEDAFDWLIKSDGGFEEPEF
jgi:hypothetical protein